MLLVISFGNYRSLQRVWNTVFLLLPALKWSQLVTEWSQLKSETRFGISMKFWFYDLNLMNFGSIGYDPGSVEHARVINHPHSAKKMVKEWRYSFCP